MVGRVKAGNESVYYGIDALHRATTVSSLPPYMPKVLSAYTARSSLPNTSCLTPKKSRELIGKLEKLASRHDAGKLRRQIQFLSRYPRHMPASPFLLRYGAAAAKKKPGRACTLVRLW